MATAGGFPDPRMMFNGGPPPPPFMRPPMMHGPPPSAGAPNRMMHMPPPTHAPGITLRIILTRDEVAFLFGFDGVLLNQLRQQTGAGLTLTDPHSHEQVLSISGTFEPLFKAFSLVCRKLWDFLAGQGPLVLRLAVPASQCGSIIGKHGAKVKEIRDLTGTNIQVSQDSLPDSTERCVEISGTGEACLQCTYHVCGILQEAPLRGEMVPYVPRPSSFSGPGAGPPGPPANDAWKPVFLCGDKAYVIEGDVAVPAPPELLRHEMSQTSSAEAVSQQPPPSHFDRGARRGGGGGRGGGFMRR